MMPTYASDLVTVMPITCELPRQEWTVAGVLAHHIAFWDASAAVMEQ